MSEPVHAAALTLAALAIACAGGSDGPQGGAPVDGAVATDADANGSPTDAALDSADGAAASDIAGAADAPDDTADPGLDSDAGRGLDVQDSAGAGADADAAASADAADIAEQAPPANADLTAWLQADHYQAWAAEPAVHASAGPHFGGVRVFFNAKLAASLQAGSATHPTGAVAVKELFGAGKTVLGWSLMQRLPTGAGGAGWHWFEVYQGKTYADAPGATLCTGCHGPGVDFVLSKGP